MVFAMWIILLLVGFVLARHGHGLRRRLPTESLSIETNENKRFKEHKTLLKMMFNATATSRIAPNGKPYCNSAQDVRKGKWVKVPDATPKDRSFTCCMWNDADYRNVPKCIQEDQGGTRKSRHYLKSSGSNEWITQSGDHACLCDVRDGGRFTTKGHGREQWEWVPEEDCVMLEWNASKFCELLGNRTMLLLGDSTMQQASTTLIDMINNEIVNSDGTHGATCAPQIHLGMSTFLTFDAGAAECGDHFAKHVMDGYASMDGKQVVAPDFVILTHGAHTHEVFDFWTILSWTYDKLEEIRKLQSHWDEASGGRVPQFLWKTQSPGHHRCDEQRYWNSSLPGSGPQEDYNYSFPWKDYPNEHRYHWGLFPYFDDVARTLAAHHNVSVIDMSALYQRPDSHPGHLTTNPSGDCLHYCIPGPLNVFSNFLLQYLQEANTMEGVTSQEWYKYHQLNKTEEEKRVDNTFHAVCGLKQGEKREKEHWCNYRR